jgi:hypothetical protein
MSDRPVKPRLDAAPEHPPARAHELPYAPPAEEVEFDREIQFHQLVWMGIGLLVMALISAVLVFFMLRGFVSWRAATAGPPSLVPAPGESSAPKLLARPEHDLAEVRAAEKEQLESYGWVDQAGGVAHIPIERAIDIISAKGLPSATAAGAATPGSPVTAGATPAGSPASLASPRSATAPAAPAPTASAHGEPL